MGDMRNMLRLGQFYIDLERIKAIFYHTRESRIPDGPRRIVNHADIFMMGDDIDDQSNAIHIEGFEAYILHDFLGSRTRTGIPGIARVTEESKYVDYFMNNVACVSIDAASTFFTWADGMADEIVDHDGTTRKALEYRRGVTLEPDARARTTWDRAMGKVQPASVHEDYARYRAAGGFLEPDAYKDLWTRYHRHLGAFGSDPKGDARLIIDGYRDMLGFGSDPEPSGRLTADALKLGPDLSRMSEMPGLDRSVMHDITHPPDDDPPADAYPAGPAGWDQV